MISNNSLSKSMCASYLQSSNMSHDHRSTIVRPSFDCRSKLLKIVTVLALLLTVGVGNVCGTDVTLTESEIKANLTKDAHAYGAGAKSFEDGTVTWYLGDFTCTASSKWFQIKKDAGCYLKITSPTGPTSPRRGPASASGSTKPTPQAPPKK